MNYISKNAQLHVWYVNISKKCKIITLYICNFYRLYLILLKLSSGTFIKVREITVFLVVCFI